MELERSKRRLRSLASSLRLSGIDRVATAIVGHQHDSGRLLVVGTVAYEPWHVVAHLQSPASIGPRVGLVRHIVAPGAPAHLSMDLDELTRLGRHDVVMFIGPDAPAEPLLERLADARRRSSALFALSADSAGGVFDELADETAVVDASRLASAQHLLAALTIDH